MPTRLFSYALWFLGLALVLAFNLHYHDQAVVFRGIAETGELNISSESSAEIARIHVVPGQSVRPGDTLVELRRAELDLRLEQIRRESQHVQGQTSASASDIDRRVGEIRAALDTRRNQIRLEIRQLQDLRRRSRELAEKLQLPEGPVDSSQGVTVQIRALERELALAESSGTSQIRLLQGSRGIQNVSGQAQALSLSQEARLLEAEKSKLAILATETAVVGTVNFHAGEKVGALVPILTLMARTPTLVRGYLQENVPCPVMAGDTVAIHSSLGARTVPGQVVGLGTRIVELPLRLRKIPTIAIWGREVTVRIPARNEFLLGELVSVEPTRGAAR